jgi:hypothetical protein
MKRKYYIISILSILFTFNYSFSQNQQVYNDSVFYFKILEKMDTIKLPLKLNPKTENILFYGTYQINKNIDEIFYNYLNINNKNKNFEFYFHDIILIDSTKIGYLLTYETLNICNMEYSLKLVSIDKKTYKKLSELIIYSEVGTFTISTINEDLTINLKTEKPIERLLLDRLKIYDKIVVTNYIYKIDEAGKINMIEKEIEGTFTAKMVRDEDVDDFYIYPVELPKK